MISACELCKMLPDTTKEERTKAFCQQVIDKALRSATKSIIRMKDFFYSVDGEWVYGHDIHYGCVNQAHALTLWGEPYTRKSQPYQYEKFAWSGQAKSVPKNFHLDLNLIKKILREHGFSVKFTPIEPLHLYSTSCSGKSIYCDKYIHTFVMDIKIDCPNI